MKAAFDAWAARFTVLLTAAYWPRVWIFCHQFSAMRQQHMGNYTAKEKRGTARNDEKILRRNSSDQADNPIVIKVPKRVWAE